ncbi:MAG: MSCRAMM family adhesin SdrC [Lachnospiraceae bacterium]|nr:MSCRAMM family adhesin SdrC [Lachnospiraceae bacterium]
MKLHPGNKKQRNKEQRNKDQRKKQIVRQCMAWLLMIGIICSSLGGFLLLLPEQNRYAEASESDAEIDVKSDAESDAKSNADSDAKSNTKSNAESNAESGAENDAQNDAETEPAAAIAWSPDAIERGVHYELTGDRDAWYLDGSGMLWIRMGTALYATPKAGSGYDVGASLENVQTDGIFTFHLWEEEDGAVLRESAAASVDYRVDGVAPGVRFLISGVSQDGIYYNSDSCTVLLYIEPDEGSGLKNAFYKIASSDPDGSVAEGTEASAWNECKSGSILEITEKGMFRIYVKTEDLVGNVTFSGSDVFCVD